MGETLTAPTSDIAAADGIADAVFEYQWLRSGAEIDEADSKESPPVAADVGSTLSVTVSFNDDEGNEESRTSAPTAAVVAATPSPIVDASTVPKDMLATLTEGAALILEDPGNGDFAIRVEVDPGATIGSMDIQISG